MKSLNLLILFMAIIFSLSTDAKKDREREETKESKINFINSQHEKLEMMPVNRSHEWLKFMWNTSNAAALVTIASLTAFSAVRILQSQKKYEHGVIYLAGYSYLTSLLLDTAYKKYICGLHALKKAWDGFGYQSRVVND